MIPKSKRLHKILEIGNQKRMI